MKAHILTRGPRKGWLCLTLEKGDRETIRKFLSRDRRGLKADVLYELLEPYWANGEFQPLSEYDIASLNDAGYTSILSDAFFIASEPLTCLQNDQGEYGYEYNPETGEYDKPDTGRDLDKRGIRLYYRYETFELITEALLKTGRCYFQPLA